MSGSKPINAVIAIVVAVAIGGLAMAWLHRTNKGNVIVVNQAVEDISAGSLEVCGQTFAISRLRVGESQEIEYEVKFDSGYNVSVIFASGKNINREIGYVTHGMDFNDKLIVQTDNLMLDRILK